MLQPTTRSKISSTSSARLDRSAAGSAFEAAPAFPPLFQVACHWAAPWLVAAGTRVGTGHMLKGAQTDDAVLVSRCGPNILFAVADGAGDPRATRSAEGSARACAVAAAAAHRSWSIYGADPQLLTEAMAAAHVDLVGRAAADGQDPMVFATTLSLVLLAGDRIVAARIGDGSLYTWDGRQLTRFCSTPLPATATPMLTQPDWRDWMATADQQKSFVQGLVVGTDGADEFFLEDDGGGQGRKPSAAMFKGLSDYCDQYGPTAAILYTMQMLNDPNWARKTGDDRSFVFAFKPQSEKATPHARHPR